MFPFIVSAFISSIVLTYLIIIWATRKVILDIPNERSSHTKPTPRGGGIAIAITWYIAITAMLILKKIELTQYLSLICGIPISLIGLFDDILSIKPSVRFIIQLVFSFLAVLIMGGFQTLEIGTFTFDMPIITSIFGLLTLLWFINLFNFLDGIDGYVSSEVIFIGLASYILFRNELTLILVASTAGFLIWNWQPAKIFMGDVGSTLLGFTIGVLAFYSINSGESTLVSWLILTSLFWFDATITLFRRWKNSEHLTQAHKKHAYQRIVQYGFTHQKTVLIAMVINSFLFLVTYVSIKYVQFEALFLAIDILLLFMLLKKIDNKKPFI